MDLWIGGVTWSADTAGTVTLYGANTHPDTMLTLRPREWALVIGKGKITLPENIVAFIRNGDPVSNANAKVSIYGSETLLAATASATVSQRVCLNQSQGPSVAMKLDEPR